MSTNIRNVCFGSAAPPLVPCLSSTWATRSRASWSPLSTPRLNQCCFARPSRSVRVQGGGTETMSRQPWAPKFSRNVASTNLDRATSSRPSAAPVCSATWSGVRATCRRGGGDDGDEDGSVRASSAEEDDGAGSIAATAATSSARRARKAGTPQALALIRRFRSPVSSATRSPLLCLCSVHCKIRSSFECLTPRTPNSAAASLNSWRDWPK